MAKTLNDITGFWKAVQNEFFALHPDVYEELMIFVGGRITDIRKDMLEEKEYIEEWKEKELICL